MWDLPEPGAEPVSPVLAGRFPTTEPLGKLLNNFFLIRSWGNSKAETAVLYYALGNYISTRHRAAGIAGGADVTRLSGSTLLLPSIFYTVIYMAFLNGKLGMGRRWGNAPGCRGA